jgi:PAS domain S-box-containing protein
LNDPKSLPFEVAANTLKDAVFLLDPNGHILWANQAAVSVVGRSAESLVNFTLTDILTPRSSEVADAALRSRIQGSSPALIELDIFRPDLSSCRLEVSLSVLADPPALVAIGRDVSERRLLDEQQRGQTSRRSSFRLLCSNWLAPSPPACRIFFHVTALAAATLDVARVSVWFTTTLIPRCIAFNSLTVSAISARAALFWRCSAIRAILALCRSIDHRHERHQIDQLTRELTDYLTGRGIRSVLAVSIRGEGKPIGMFVLAATGEPRHWKIDEQNFGASLADLTALALETDRRRQAEAELRKSLGNLELFFSQSLDGFFFMMLDEPIPGAKTLIRNGADTVFQHQHVTKINDAMLSSTGFASNFRRTPHDLFAHDLAHGRELWRRMFDAGRLHVESDERRLDGSRMWVEGDYICFYDAEGKITGHFGIQRDVTERKQAEEALLIQSTIEASSTDRPGDPGAHSIEDIANAAVVHVHELLPCLRASVVVFDAAGGSGRVVGVRALGDTQVAVGAEIPLGIFGSLEQLREGKAHIVSDVDEMPGQETVCHLQQEGIRSFVNIPLVAESTLIGTLNLGSDSVAAFSAEHIEIAQEVANSMAVAIRHAQLNRQIERHAAELEQRVAERTTELLAANAQLRESEDRLASVLRSAMDAIVVIDQSRTIVIFNQAAEHIFRCEPRSHFSIDRSVLVGRSHQSPGKLHGRSGI